MHMDVHKHSAFVLTSIDTECGQAISGINSSRALDYREHNQEHGINSGIWLTENRAVGVQNGQRDAC